MVLAGGSDALCPFTLSGFNSLQALDRDPCRPFDQDRKGLNLGEGAAVLVLETLAHATQRGARVLAVLRGWAMTNAAADEVWSIFGTVAGLAGTLLAIDFARGAVNFATSFDFVSFLMRVTFINAKSLGEQGRRVFA